ncbi:MAG: magnesium transporter ['Candidatus Kapabacteria' thiocyanatum]|uniref:Magnesium transporter MgtE n=1 Tax=Candidatus Kapaibacterium thiocyanatum TaxID=1895771 RepID=A0A1M3L354_9BACT|nr:magnesium transporter ['Candidatus Kapabacteria' thiocyanatum]OJX59739.1 MAG: magnesium transporter ['Candidatus Kapabacteria' thiocyanatum]
MYGNLITPEIEELIAVRDFETIREVFADWDAIDLADLISELREESRVVVFRLLPKDVASDTFSYCDFDTQQDLLHDMAKEEVASVLNEMSPDDRTQLFEDLPGNVVSELINTLSAEERSIALALLNYPEDSVGRLMTPDYVIVKKHWTVQQALDHIRNYGKDSETLNMLYVTEHGTLIDEIHIREILLSRPESLIEDLMDEKCPSLLATDDQETAVQAFKKLDRFALPVIDSDGKLLGIVTLDDVLDVAEAQATEEMQKFGGVEALEEPYISVPLMELVRKRATWLVVLFLGGFLTATALSVFQATIERAVMLALFLPLIISSGGNSGSQAATLIVRALALGEVTLSDWWRIMRRELAAGLLLGILLGFLGFLRIMIGAWMDGTTSPTTWMLALVVCLSLVGIVLAGTIAGSMLPLLMKRLGFDPAASSAPFVATFSDVTGIIIYFSIATLLLGGYLL